MPHLAAAAADTNADLAGARDALAAVEAELAEFATELAAGRTCPPGWPPQTGGY